jgi:hypothetical protein
VLVDGEAGVVDARLPELGDERDQHPRVAQRLDDDRDGGRAGAEQLERPRELGRRGAVVIRPAVVGEAPPLPGLAGGVGEVSPEVLGKLGHVECAA